MTVNRIKPITIAFFEPSFCFIDPLKGAKMIYATENIEMMRAISLSSKPALSLSTLSQSIALIYFGRIAMMLLIIMFPRDKEIRQAIKTLFF